MSTCLNTIIVSTICSRSSICLLRPPSSTASTKERRNSTSASYRLLGLWLVNFKGAGACQKLRNSSFCPKTFISYPKIYQILFRGCNMCPQKYVWTNPKSTTYRMRSWTKIWRKTGKTYSKTNNLYFKMSIYSICSRKMPRSCAT